MQFVQNKLYFIKKHAKIVVPLLLFLGITIFYFHKMIYGFVPIPLDILVGGYFPWLDYKWGFIVGVPVKNPSLSDVFSQLYPWRGLAMDIIRQGQIPLWNPYMFSGTPFLANWQSAPFYPLNILMLIFGNMWGWSLMIAFQPLLSMLFMYFYLRQLNLNTLSAMLGSIIFAFSGFMVTYLEYGTGGQIFLWLPLFLFLIEKYLSSQKLLYLLIVPLACYFVLTAGFFQPALYCLGFAFVYFLFRIFQQNSLKKSVGLLKILVIGISIFLLGIGLSAVQLLPTTELLAGSFRNLDKNIVDYAYGLLPIVNIVTFFSPDFFGNPATGNFWGFMGYQETSGYMGVASLVFIFLAIIRYKKRSGLVVFLGVCLIGTLLLAFNTPAGKLIYFLKIPMLSTGYAARILFLTTFLGAILAALGYNFWLSSTNSGEQNLAKKISFWMMIPLIGILFGLLISVLILSSSPLSDDQITLNLKTALRNSIIPCLILFTLFLGFKFMPKKYLIIPVFLILIFDLLRFAIKFNTFSPINQNFPNTPVIDFVQSKIGNFRIDKERAELLPSNTWLPYHLMSPSGYDPLYSKQYASFFNVYNGNPPENYFGRYAELDKYNLPILDLAGVKYLLITDRGKIPYLDNIGQENSQTSLDQGKDLKFKKAYQDKSIVVLENQQVLPRVTLYDKYDVEADYSKALTMLYNNYNFRDKIIINLPIKNQELGVDVLDQATITNYQTNEVEIKTSTKKSAILMLTDSYYPGWKVSVNKVEQPLLVADGIFRAVEIPAGESDIKFYYQPRSFFIGAAASLFSALILGSLILGRFIFRKKIL